MSLGGSPLRRRLGRALRPVVRAPLERLDSSTRVLVRRTRASAPGPLAFVCVYRRALAPNVIAMRAALPAGSRVGLWSLDEVDPALAADTLGCGPGARLALLNRLATLLELDPSASLLVCDDDVRFASGSPSLLARAADRFGLDLCQPAHAWSSEVSHRFTRRRLATLARRTGWVEQGPVVLFGPRARERLMPLPEELPWPAWGVEAAWAREERRGLRLGIVDAVAIVHTQRIAATGYSLEAAWRQEADLLRASGFSSSRDMQVGRGRWRSWREELTRGEP